MGKTAKSQWDFGELFPTEQTRKVLSVTELTVQVRRLLEERLGRVWVAGEITNLRLQSSGHIYFTLKDAASQLSCVLFRGESQADRSGLQDGRRVVLRGDLTVYEPRGQYQLRVVAVELEGVGALQAAFERLKQKLKTEGLFAAERKRALPRFPERIGLVTSPTGAAIRDVLHVVQRRNPALQIVLVPCRVQGDGAAAEIAAAIRLLNEFARSADPTVAGHGTQGEARPNVPAPDSSHRLDLILITRGGGSLEDLWAFNEEIVARAVFDSAVPVVSAVGHEIDFTISDFVADVRAATPSAGAEIITEGVFSSCQFLGQAANRLRVLLDQHLADMGYELTQVRGRLARLHPRRRLDDQLQRLDERQASLQRSVKLGVAKQAVAWHNLADRLARVRPALLLKQRSELLRQVTQNFRDHVTYRIRELENRLASAQSRLGLLGPEQVLARGYSITLDASTGSIVRQASEAKPGQLLKTRLQHGQVTSRVEQNEPPAETQQKGELP